MNAVEGTVANWASTRRSFDALVERVQASRLSLDEADLLRDSHWALGQDARLREDVRLRLTPWGRWIRASAYLANDEIFGRLHDEPHSSLDVQDALSAVAETVGRWCVICSADPRLVIDASTVRLSARELSDQPLLETDLTGLERYTTHLPIHTLKAAAASAPAGEWGGRAQEQIIETLGWVQVTVPGRPLNRRMFVARIEGESMDDGRSGIVDGQYAVFELWPTGSRQGLNVLVRGAFSDPETGTYAIKKYVADLRDADGRHQRITLVSLNPDKARFPDIHVSVEQEDEVSIVARVVHVLAPSELARKPKPPRRPGRRDLSATQEIFEKLSDFSRRFFEGMPTAQEEDSKAAQATWTSELVCLDAESGGLHIEVGPLVGLWSFIKQLRVESHESRQQVLASNARQRPVRVPVSAAGGPWTWVPVGFEDDPDIDLSGIALSGLEADRAHVFRVDAAGVGRRIAGSTLSRGQHYRLLVPESVWQELAPSAATAVTMTDGWRLWGVELAEADLGPVLETLLQLRLDVGEGEGRLEWVLVPPVQWSTSLKGQPFPCFLSSAAPVLSISGPPVGAEGAAEVYVGGPAGTETLSLAKGENWFVRVSDLAPGRYSVALFYDRTRVAPSYAAFEVVKELPLPPRPEGQLSVGGTAVNIVPGSPVRLAIRDFGTFELSNPDECLQLQVPPGWPVRVLWREVSEDVLLTLNADEDGRVDPNAMVKALVDRSRRRPVGDVVLDLGELGRVVLPHHRRPTPENVRSTVRDMLERLGETVERLSGNYEVLLPRWFEPLCAELGYELEHVPADPDSVPGHYRVCKLYRVERQGRAIRRSPRRLLILAESVDESTQEVRAWLDEACAAHELREALLTDGLRWALHRWDSRVPLKVWNLKMVIADEADFVAFLRDAAEGV